MSKEESLQTAVMMIETEGFRVDEQSKDLCRQLQAGAITMEQYIDCVKKKAGVKS